MLPVIGALRPWTDPEAVALQRLPMRVPTTAYDSLSIARIKGERRAVRRALAEVSRSVLDLHRRDTPHGLEKCPLCSAIVRAVEGEDPDLT